VKVRYKPGYDRRGRRVKIAQVVARNSLRQPAAYDSLALVRTRVDVSSRVGEIADRCENVLRSCGVQFVNRGGDLVVLQRRGSCRRHLSRRAIETILIEKAEFGKYNCKDAKGRPACFEPRGLPRDAVTHLLDRFVKKAAFAIQGSQYAVQ
ncbi:MAG: hypothetical protein WBG10_18810, partial [Pseudolabrys sp.]